VLATTRDTDLDGVQDRFDLDSDNDGLPDLLEAGGIDSDNDGVVDGTMIDTNNNGLLDALEASPLAVPDTDGDGVEDYRDLDSDNDSILDVIESGRADANGDGIFDGFINDPEGDGFSNDAQGTAFAVRDTDNDNAPDHLDLDSDNDSISDLVEAGIVDHLIADPDDDGVLDLADSDGDGISDDADLASGVFGSNNHPAPLDSNGDDIPDTIVLDSNGDGIFDIDSLTSVESPLDQDNDGRVDNASDSDKDGVSDQIDNLPGQFGGIGVPTDTDGDSVPDSRDLDSDNDGIPNAIEGMGDSDGDGIPDRFDLDSDNDGIPDLVEAGGVDSDDDGRVDDKTDADKNGVADSLDAAPLAVSDTDGDSIPDFLDVDSDNDGIPDAVEAGGVDENNNGQLDGFIDLNLDGKNDGSSLPRPDTDNDNTPNHLDVDSDGDGIADLVEAGSTDLNNDGRVDSITDENLNGLDDRYEIFSANNVLDTDADGVPNYLDLDADNDGIPDVAENGLVDADSNGVADDASAGLARAADFDNDGVPNFLDLDSDNDGILDQMEGASGDTVLDENMVDANQNGWADALEGMNVERDTDLDAQPDYLDLDSDNDGLADVVEAGGLDFDRDGFLDDFADGNNNGLADSAEQTPLPVPDSDNDGTRDYLDLDSDNDAVPDVVEGGFGDWDGDYLLDDFADADGNGRADSTDRAPLPVIDTDRDGIPDYRDLDSDNDACSDLFESQLFDDLSILDANNDGALDAADEDGDGISDSIDQVPNQFGSTGNPPRISSSGQNPWSGDDRRISDMARHRFDLDLSQFDADGDGILDDVIDLDGDGIMDVVDEKLGQFAGISLPLRTPCPTPAPQPSQPCPTPLPQISAACPTPTTPATPMRSSTGSTSPSSSFSPSPTVSSLASMTPTASNTAFVMRPVASRGPPAPAPIMINSPNNAELEIRLSCGSDCSEVDVAIFIRELDYLLESPDSISFLALREDVITLEVCGSLHLREMEPTLASDSEGAQLVSITYGVPCAPVQNEPYYWFAFDDEDSSSGQGRLFPALAVLMALYLL